MTSKRVTTIREVITLMVKNKHIKFLGADEALDQGYLPKDPSTFHNIKMMEIMVAVDSYSHQFIAYIGKHVWDGVQVYLPSISEPELYRGV